MNTFNPIAYPLSFSDNPQCDRLECSNLVLLPPEILQNIGMDWFSENKTNMPSFFNLTFKDKSVNVGVLEFTEIPDVIYLPWHLFRILDLKEGERIDVKMLEEDITTATEITLKPHSYKFVELPNPKEILETLISKNYPIITLHDILKIKHEGEEFYISVTKLEPHSVVKMLNCDVNLIFEPAVDYVSPEVSPCVSPSQKMLDSSEDTCGQQMQNRVVTQFKSEQSKQMGFVPFSGNGNRLGSN